MCGLSKPRIESGGAHAGALLDGTRHFQVQGSAHVGVGLENRENSTSRKVERPMARLSEAPMRVKTASKTCSRALAAGTKEPT
jgi:hypothetical protein